MVCGGQAVLQELERPLLSTSVHVEAEGELEIPEGAVMMDMFAGRGLDFVVDCGTRVRRYDLQCRTSQMMSQVHECSS